MKTVSVIQSNYLPWKGYFDIIYRSDLFIFYDDVQYTKQDWRNRNLIKTRNGLRWITVPCGSDENRLVCEVVLTDGWQQEHLNKIKDAYINAPHFDETLKFLDDIYLKNWKTLSELNHYSIRKICGLLGIKTRMVDSRDYDLSGRKQDRLLELLKKTGRKKYISGPAAKDYIDEKLFEKNGIKIEWMKYDYREYPQLHGEFVHGVSIIDMLMNLGDKTPRYIWR